MSRFTFGSKGLGGPHYVFEDAPPDKVLSEAEIARYAIAECASFGDAMRIRDALAALVSAADSGQETA